MNPTSSLTIAHLFYLILAMCIVLPLLIRLMLKRGNQQPDDALGILQAQVNKLEAERRELASANNQLTGDKQGLLTQINNLNDELNAAQSKSQEKVNEISQLLNQQISSLKAEKDEFKREYETDISSLKAEHDKQLGSLKTEYIQSINELKTAHNKEIDDRKQEYTQNLGSLKTEHHNQISSLKKDLEEVRRQLNQSQRQHNEASSLLAAKESELEALSKNLQQTSNVLKIQFQELSEAILRKETQKLEEVGVGKIKEIAQPLMEKLKQLNQEVRNNSEKFTIGSNHLKDSIERLNLANQQLHSEAQALTDALNGTKNKLQGNWGEMVLTSILENSGLRLGEEFETQVAIKAEDGSRLMPDAVLKLPNDKVIVIDSKVSLTAYSRYVSDPNGEHAQQELKNHVTSLQNHIKSLASRDYTSAVKVGTLDFVLLFIPIDYALLAALDQDKELINQAIAKRVAIVTPTTLMTVLRLVEFIWKNEKQTRNTQEIAELGGKLYDKLVDFATKLQEADYKLSQAVESMRVAKSHLSEGRGSAVKCADQLRQLGVQNKKDKHLPDILEVVDMGD